MNLQRWEERIYDPGLYCSKDGEWVLYDEVQEKIDQLEKEIEILKAKLISKGEETMPSTPPELKSHSADYKSDAWKDYSFQELGWWVHLFAKRATHRTTIEKIKKDLYDARNYLKMMEAKLDDLEGEI